MAISSFPGLPPPGSHCSSSPPPSPSLPHSFLSPSIPARFPCCRKIQMAEWGHAERFSFGFTARHDCFWSFCTCEGFVHRSVDIAKRTDISREGCPAVSLMVPAARHFKKNGESHVCWHRRCGCKKLARTEHNDGFHCKKNLVIAFVFGKGTFCVP